MSAPTTIAMIPARAGSERLKLKNLRLLAGKPVIGHVIEAARDSGVFSRIVVNADHPAFGDVAKRFGAEFYLRPAPLGSSEARSDDVVADFMGQHAGDVLVWVNPIAPLQPAAEIRQVVGHFNDGEFDSLITVKDEQVHCVFEGRPVNFDPHELFAKTQDLTPVQPFVYSLMMWRYASFLKHYAAHGYALLSGRLGYYPVGRDSTAIIKREEDLRVAEALIAARSGAGAAEYDHAADEIVAAEAPCA